MTITHSPANVSAILVTYRTGSILWACLDALGKVQEISEIIIVDNGLAEADEAKLDARAAQNAQLTIIRGHGNIGFGAGCNLGARAANGRDVLFVNPDVVLEPYAVAKMQAALSDARAPALMGGDLRNNADRPERGSRRLRLTLWRAFVSFTGLSRLERLAPAFADINRENDPPPASPEPIGAVSGALMIMRLHDFHELGGFDEGYFLHVEDFDLCRRVEEAGGEVLFVPGARGMHQTSSSDAPRAFVEAHKARSFRRYFKKFAKNPIERVMGDLTGRILEFVLPLRARK